MIDLVSKILVKDETELYKYLIFLFNLVFHLSEQRDCFIYLMAFIRNQIQKFVDLQFDKCYEILNEMMFNFITS